VLAQPDVPQQVVPPQSQLHRAARLATLVLLIIGGCAGVALVAFSLYARSQSIDAVRGAGVMNGLRLAAKLNVAYIAVIGAGALAALALAYAIVKRHRWALLAAVLGSGAGIAAAQYALTIITKLEDPRYVKKSPWVRAASSVTLVATIFLALVIVVSIVAFVSQRRAPKT
jgi:hypothetical protein